MSYKFYPERIDCIGQLSGAVGENLLIPVDGIDGMRVTISHLSVSCGADDQVLNLLQVEECGSIAAIDNDLRTITTHVLSRDLTDKMIAVEVEEGFWRFLVVSSCDGKVYTVDEDILDLKIDGRFLIFSEEESLWNQRVPLKGGEETVIADAAPGRLIARDFCYPVIISISNVSSAVKFNGATVVYISR